MSSKKRPKKYVARGEFHGDTVVVVGEVNEDTVMVELTDDHGKVISDNAFPMSKGDLEDM